MKRKGKKESRRRRRKQEKQTVCLQLTIHLFDFLFMKIHFEFVVD